MEDVFINEQIESDDKNYKATAIIIKPSNKKLLNYCTENAQLAKLFRNAVIYRCRQLFFAYQKHYENLSNQELEVIAEFESIGKTFSYTKYFNLPSYLDFVKMFTVMHNVDYFNELPQQSSQQIIKKVLSDFKGYRNSLKKYYKAPEQFTGKPKLPHYVKSDITTYIITNQDAVIKNGNVLKLPKTKITIPLGSLNIKCLKQVEIKPFYDTYKIILVEEIKDTSISNLSDLSENRILGIDLGINNFVSTSNNCGLAPFIVNGKGLKAYNQWYNKELSKMRSQLPLNVYSSKAIQKLNLYRNNFTSDFYNKCASYIVKYCLSNKIGTIIIGKNDYWKNESNIGTTNNQNFCFIAHSVFIKKLEVLAVRFNINVIRTEESYTSKASFLDNDQIPVYDQNSETAYSFSSKRQYRGLYKSKEGILINADVNGASNIIKKVIPDAFDDITDFSYLYITTENVNIIKTKNKPRKKPKKKNKKCISCNKD